MGSAVKMGIAAITGIAGFMKGGLRNSDPQSFCKPLMGFRMEEDFPENQDERQAKAEAEAKECRALAVYCLVHVHYCSIALLSYCWLFFRFLRKIIDDYQALAK